MPSLKNLTIKIFADGADRAGMLEMAQLSYIAGFTTNPTLMRKADVADYEGFARDVLTAIPDRPISFEVFSDDVVEMERQARQIPTWEPNVYGKIPVTNTKGEPTYDLIHCLAHSMIKVNVTAVLTLNQVREVSAALAGPAPGCVSVFAGRIRRHGARSRARHGCGRRATPPEPERRADLGEPTRAAEHLPSRYNWLSDHYCDQ